MPFPTLEKLKAQCRIDDDNSAEDDLLMTYALAAKKRAENYINRTLYDDENIPETDPDGLLISDDIELAIMLAVGHFYESRETTAMSAGFKALLEPYRFINL